MPALDRIKVHPQDLVEILERVRQMKHNDEIEIVDTSNTLTIRDVNGMFLTDIKKQVPAYNGA